MSYFVIQWPWMLLLLIGLIPLARMLTHARRQRSRVYESLGRTKPGSSVVRDRLRLLCMGLLIIALSRPGFDPERRAVAQSGRDVVFAIDVSQSMLARDAQPSRLDTAKQGVRDALEQFRNERVGLLIYAGSASILCPLTRDYDFVRYMLDQATPRSVDFGGTTLLAAVEKSVDTIFLEGRDGMQDLVILTDGEDHAFDTDRIVETLESSGIDLLIVGIGDSLSGARIPVENEEGNLTYLKYKEREVYTKLQEASLQELAGRMPGSTYVGPGTAAFDLGGVYFEFALEKPVSESSNGEAYIVCKEAGLILVGLSLLLFLVTDGVGKRLFPILIAALVTGAIAPEQISLLEESFGTALNLQRGGNHSEAIEAYGDLQLRVENTSIHPTQLAVIRFNQGLCHLELANSQGDQSPEGALASAQMAKTCFLEAKRMNPALDRSGQRLDPIGQLIHRYEVLVQEKEEQEQAMQEQLNKLIERLEALHGDQMDLRGIVANRDPNSPQNRSNRKRTSTEPPPEPIIPPSPDEINAFIKLQHNYHSEGDSIHGELAMLNSLMTPPPMPGEPEVKGLLNEPVELMVEAVDFQKKALDQLPEIPAWEMVRANQNHAGEKILEILELLASDSSESDDEGDWDDYEDDWDMEDYEEGEEGMPSSQMMQGDLAAGSEMQPLPIPNYSAEELLMEEVGNLQFRQEQRAKAQAGKVEKDW